MLKLTKEDEIYKNQLLSMANEKVLEWAQQKGMEIQRIMTYYRCAIMEIETKFRVLDAEYSMQHDRNPINSIKTRLKKIESIVEKLDRKNLEISLESIEENIFDVAGIRVICSFEEDVYTLAEALLRQDDVTLIQKKDYIKNPKPNGYRSQHLIVAVPIFLGNEKRIMHTEIQLRTIAMDCWASLEHQLRYKKNREKVDEIEKELYECAKLSQELDERMDRLRVELDI